MVAAAIMAVEAITSAGDMIATGTTGIEATAATGAAIVTVAGIMIPMAGLTADVRMYRVLIVHPQAPNQKISASDGRTSHRGEAVPTRLEHFTGAGYRLTRHPQWMAGLCIRECKSIVARFADCLRCLAGTAFRVAVINPFTGLFGDIKRRVTAP